MATEAEIEAAAQAIIASMFAPHELPLSARLLSEYRETARDALEAAERVRGRVGGGRHTHNKKVRHEISECALAFGLEHASAVFHISEQTVARYITEFSP